MGADGVDQLSQLSQMDDRHSSSGVVRLCRPFRRKRVKEQEKWPTLGEAVDFAVKNYPAGARFTAAG
jgi:hypothetical protein